ncbi:MAG: hypothetical protein IH627_10960 [Rubrivivax sp.]|nr:hypothetical protein [Rubrivivax sp.]
MSSQRVHSEATEISHPYAVILGLATLSAIAAPATGVPPSERELHTAQCVAALDANTRELARQVKGGHDELRPMLLSRLEGGATFIGAAYLAGDRDEERSRALLDSALEAQKSLPESEVAARQANCADEGARQFAAANALERAVVRRVAAKRMKRLLAE